MIEYTVKVDNDGSKFWYLNGKQHREDGPAVEYPAGDKHWFLNGKRHREDGPAVETCSGAKFWFLNGQEYTEETFLKKTQPVKEMTIEDIEKQLGYTIKVVK